MTKEKQGSWKKHTAWYGQNINFNDDCAPYVSLKETHRLIVAVYLLKKLGLYGHASRDGNPEFNWENLEYVKASLNNNSAKVIVGVVVIAIPVEEDDNKQLFSTQKVYIKKFEISLISFIFTYSKKKVTKPWQNN